MQSAHSKTASAASASAATPTVACRIPIFAPTRRPHVSEWKVDTPWGTAIISGRLGQQHRDLLDAARVVAAGEQWTMDGRLHIKIDIARLRSAMGGDCVNVARIEEWVEDMRKARVEVHLPDGQIIVGGIISEYTLSADTTLIPSRPGMRGDGRRYMRLSFGTGWSRLIEGTRATYYPLAKVVGLRYGFSQAVARFCLSHKTVNDSIEGMMEKVGAGGRLRDRRAEIMDDADRIASMGIVITGNRVIKREQSPVTRDQSPVTRDQSPVTRDQSPVSASKVQ